MSMKNSVRMLKLNWRTHRLFFGRGRKFMLLNHFL